MGFVGQRRSLASDLQFGSHPRSGLRYVSDSGPSPQKSGLPNFVI